MPFEYFVRPYQTPDAHGRVIVPSTPSTSTERATLTWGSQHAATGTLPTPHSMGVNIQCCHEIINEQERTGDTIKIEASNDPATYAMVHRATEVKLRKKEENNCDDWLKKNSYVAAGVKQAFDAMAKSIHASDASFLPAGAATECRQTLKLKPNTTPV